MKLDYWPKVHCQNYDCPNLRPLILPGSKYATVQEQLCEKCYEDKATRTAYILRKTKA